MNTAAATRKLIDINGPVMHRLSIKAANAGVSLKKYIENLLEEDSLSEGPYTTVPGVTSPRVLGLVGIARSIKKGLSHPEDEKLNYILSK